MTLLPMVTRMDGRSYNTTCEEGHTIQVRHTPIDWRAGLESGTLRFWCQQRRNLPTGPWR
jgi:hypothetical protein